jgi:hypothetical protein
MSNTENVRTLDGIDILSLLLQKHSSLPGYHCGIQETENFVAARALSGKNSYNIS